MLLIVCIKIGVNINGAERQRTDTTATSLRTGGPPWRGTEISRASSDYRPTPSPFAGAFGPFYVEVHLRGPPSADFHQAASRGYQVARVQVSSRFDLGWRDYIRRKSAWFQAATPLAVGGWRDGVRRLTGAGRRLSSRSQPDDPRGRGRFLREPAPKEQPPRKLSGERTAGGRRSGKRSRGGCRRGFHRRGKPAGSAWPDARRPISQVQRQRGQAPPNRRRAPSRVAMRESFLERQCMCDRWADAARRPDGPARRRPGAAATRIPVGGGPARHGYGRNGR